MSTNAASPDAPTNQQLAAELQQLRDRVATLEDENEQLRETVEEKDERIEELEAEVARLDSNLEVAINKGSTNTTRIGELQARELEKGAHLLEENVPEGVGVEYAVDVADGRLEKIQKEDGETYLRVPESDDPLGRGGSTQLAHADLLPIQQLAQMDDDMLNSATKDLPSRLAAKLWKARVDPSAGSNPWQKGSGDVREYVKSSDIKSFIYRQEGDITEEYAKKLVSRTISRLLDYSNNKVAVQKKDQRKNGLTYKERFVEIRSDVPIPGETGGEDEQPETDGVLG